MPRDRVEATASVSGQGSVALVGGSYTVTFISALGQMTAPFDCPASGTANPEALICQSLIPACNAIQLAILAAGGRGLFETPAAGRAATTDGQIFLAPLSPAGVGIYRRDSATVSPQIGTYFGGEVTVSPTDITVGRLLTTGAGPVQAYRRGNVLGAVSQESGVPTGGLIERGSNANGEFARWADGTQICWHKLTATGAINVAFLGGFRNAGQTWIYPASFVAPPVIQGSPGNFSAISVVTNSVGTLAASVFSTAIASQASATLVADVTAIGRWF